MIGKIPEADCFGQYGEYRMCDVCPLADEYAEATENI